MEITSSTTFQELVCNNRISTQLYNCMRYRKLKTILDAKKYFEKTDSPLLDKLREELNNLFYFADVNKNNSFECIGESDCENTNFLLDKYVSLKEMNSAGLISNRLYNCLTKSGFEILQDVITYTKDSNVFKNIKGLGETTLDELRRIFLRLDNTVAAENIELKNLRVYDIVRHLNKNLYFNILFSDINKNEQLKSFYEEYYKICHNKIYKDEIVSFYEKLKKNSSGRTENFLNKYIPNIETALFLYYLDKDILYKCDNCGKKTIEEVYNIAISLHNYVCELFVTDVDSLLKNMYKRDFPFLLDDDVNFVLSFYKNNSYLPMFFILYNCLVSSNCRFEKFFCEYNGINCESKSIRSLSEKYGMSEGSIRRILSNKEIKYPRLIKREMWDGYGFLKKIIFKRDADFEEIVYNENLYLIPFHVFMSLCSLIIDVEKFNVNGITYYISSQLLEYFDVSNSLKDIKNTIAQKRSKSVLISTSIFIDTYVIKVPQFDTAIIYDLIERILIESYGLSVVNDKTILERNHIDFKDIIYKIIEKNNSPMHIDTIRTKLIEKYPKYANMSIEKLRSDILRHPNIKSIGKKSTYTLDKWNVYTGTIKELLYEILSKSNNPLELKDLYEIIVMRFPSTTEKSIATLLYLDDKFIRFNRGLYGLNNKLYSNEYKVCNSNRHRLSFEERCEEYEKFVMSHHHSPQSNGTEEERSLLRWYNNVISGRISITEAQSIIFDNIINKYKDYIMSGEEYSYYRTCKEFELFLEENYIFPSEDVEDEKKLYKWFYRELSRYKSYQDKRGKYFENMLLILGEYGFVFE